jgi:hypothetical protein
VIHHQDRGSNERSCLNLLSQSLLKTLAARRDRAGVA